MSTVEIESAIPNGEIILPPSKSAAHRALLCSFLAGGGNVSPIINSDDMKATIGAIKALENNNDIINCIESGSTLRFIIPVAAALGRSVTFEGEGRLPQRPLDEYTNLLPIHGVNVKSSGGLPFSISGRLKAGHYDIRGDISSQYITGLLLALPLLDGDSAINLTTPLESKPYVDMTIAVMEQYGVFVFETDFGYLIKGNQHYKKTDFTVEGDWSQASFFLSMAAIGGDITIKGVNNNSTQGDKVVCDIMERFGADITYGDDFIRCKRKELLGTVINATDIPDMVPSLAVTAAFAKGETIITGAKRLRFKESDRLKAVAQNLVLMGVDVKEEDDGIVIYGGNVNGAALNGFNDHRIVMAFSVAAMFAKGKSTIDEAESINKSYPSYFDDYKKLGGKVCLL